MEGTNIDVRAFNFQRRERSVLCKLLCGGVGDVFGCRHLDILLVVGFGEHPLSLGTLLQHPLSCGGIPGFFGLQFEDVDELMDGVRGHVWWWYNTCNGIGETVGGANECIGRHDCWHRQIFVLEKYCAAYSCVPGVIVEDFVAAKMFW